MMNEVAGFNAFAESAHARTVPALFKDNSRPPEDLPSVQKDLRSFRRQLEKHGIELRAFTRHNTFLTLFHIGMDWLIVLLAWRLVIALPHMLTVPAALVLIGSRQRALGNLLHDASHYLLCTSKRINDVVAQLFLALPMVASIREYRQSHFQHHANLGDQIADPDYFAGRTFRRGRNTAGQAFRRMAFDRKYWLENGFGGFLTASGSVRLRLFTWWLGTWTFLSWISSPVDASAFVALWFGSRLTAFHLITSFREICDHTGLIPGGVFSYTRNIVGTSLLNQIFHPHDNGYHLVHHLAPAIPCHRLPAAHRAFMDMPAYATQAVYCDGYFTGDHPAIVCWVERTQNHE